MLCYVIYINAPGAAALIVGQCNRQNRVPVLYQEMLSIVVSILSLAV